MHQKIAVLNDQRALQVLSKVAIAHAGQQEPTPAIDERLAGALRACVAVIKADESTPSDGDLARAALSALAEDPRHAPAVLALASGPEPRSFDAGATIAVLTAALVVLQTRIDFRREADGTWKLSVRKESASDELLRAFVGQVLAYFESHKDEGGGR